MIVNYLKKNNKIYMLTIERNGIYDYYELYYSDIRFNRFYKIGLHIHLTPANNNILGRQFDYWSNHIGMNNITNIPTPDWANSVLYYIHDYDIMYVRGYVPTMMGKLEVRITNAGAGVLVRRLA